VDGDVYYFGLRWHWIARHGLTVATKP
jgi:hypothetical protein